MHDNYLYIFVKLYPNCLLIESYSGLHIGNHQLLVYIYPINRILIQTKGNLILKLTISVELVKFDMI